MTRLGRYLVNAVTGLSILLCVAAATLWVRGGRATDVISHRGRHLWQAVAGDGRLYVQRVAYVVRAGEARAELPPRGATRPSPPTPGMVPVVTEFTETQSNYVDWVADRARGRRPPAMPRSWRWAALGPSTGWLRFTEPASASSSSPSATRPASARAARRPTADVGVQNWLVDGRFAVEAAAASRWPGTHPVALHAGTMRSMEFDREARESRIRDVEHRLNGRTVWVPLWLIVAATGALPLARGCGGAVRRLRARSRTRQNRCPACGYDLRGSPERCPECGRAAVKSRGT